MIKNKDYLIQLWLRNRLSWVPLTTLFLGDGCIVIAIVCVVIHHHHFHILLFLHQWSQIFLLFSVFTFYVTFLSFYFLLIFNNKFLFGVGLHRSSNNAFGGGTVVLCQKTLFPFHIHFSLTKKKVHFSNFTIHIEWMIKRMEKGDCFLFKVCWFDE